MPLRLRLAFLTAAVVVAAAAAASASAETADAASSTSSSSSYSFSASASSLPSAAAAAASQHAAPSVDYTTLEQVFESPLSAAVAAYSAAAAASAPLRFARGHYGTDLAALAQRHAAPPSGGSRPCRGAVVRSRTDGRFRRAASSDELAREVARESCTLPQEAMAKEALGRPLYASAVCEEESAAAAAAAATLSQAEAGGCRTLRVAAAAAATTGGALLDASLRTEPLVPVLDLRHAGRRDVYPLLLGAKAAVDSHRVQALLFSLHSAFVCERRNGLASFLRHLHRKGYFLYQSQLRVDGPGAAALAGAGLPDAPECPLQLLDFLCSAGAAASAAEKEKE
eukprot:Rhum_TRINITY_DN14851_c0_g1::Rhum_TRINITY_DN14851_c0_g1_i1::g.122911::m.122911